MAELSPAASTGTAAQKLAMRRYGGEKRRTSALHQLTVFDSALPRFCFIVIGRLTRIIIPCRLSLLRSGSLDDILNLP